MGARSIAIRRESIARPTASSSHSLAQYLAVVSPHLHNDLVSNQARTYLDALARRLPVFDLAGFECRLTPNSDQVDLIVRVPQGTSKLPKRLARDPVWRPIQKLCRTLNDPTTALYDAVNVVDLEFDLAEEPIPVPRPAVFFELDRQVDLSLERVLGLAGELLGGRMTVELVATLKHCLGALPASGRVIHLGSMLSRSGAGLRVVAQLPANHFISYLTAIGEREIGHSALSTLAKLPPVFESFMVSLDLAAAVSPRVGIECFIGSEKGGLSKWKALMDRLQALELCTQRKTRAFLAWYGICQEGVCSGPWPDDLRLGDRLLGGHVLSVFARFLSHIKLVLRPRIPLEVKGYLGFAHYWLSSEQLQGLLSPA